MATPDIKIDIYRKAAELLSADTEWAGIFDVANRINLDETPTPTHNPFNFATSDGDYPRFSMTMPSGSTSLRTSDETFATHSDEPPTEWIERHSYILRITMISQLLKLSEATDFVSVTENVFRKAGPRMGLTYVTSVTISWEMSDVEINREEDQKRIKTTFTVAVGCEIQGSTLTGE